MAERGGFRGGFGGGAGGRGGPGGLILLLVSFVK